METAVPRSQASGRSVTRTRAGCLVCRRRKVRCDQSSTPHEARSSCGNCVRLKLDCQYAPPGTRRKPPRRTSEARGTSGSATGISSSEQYVASKETPTGRTNTGNSAQNSSSSTGMSQPMETAAPNYLPQEQENSNMEQMPLDRAMSDMSELSAFPNDPSWQLSFPPDIMNSINDLFPSALLPWKDFHPYSDPLNGAAETPFGSQLQGQLQEFRPGPAVPETSHGRVGSSASSSTPRSTANREPLASTQLAGIDLAQFDVTEHQRQLLQSFTPQENPMPLITPADSQWKSAYFSLISLARECPYLVNAICAVSELHLTVTKQGSVTRAFKYYQSAAAKAEAVLNLSTAHLDDRSLKQAFATLFLLMHAEIMAQPLVGHQNWPIKHLRSPSQYLKRHHERLRSWTGMGSNIISWIRIVESKAIYAAGMDKETDRSSQDPRQQTISVQGDAMPETDSVSQGSPVTSRSVRLSPDIPILSSDPPPASVDESATSPLEEPLSAAGIAYDAFYQPAYRFYMQCQCFIPRIIALDVHHRPRGPLDAELEVLQLGQQLRADLREMWLKRPQILSVLADTEALHEVLQPRVAQKITASFRSFVANYHAIGILLHRVAFVKYPASDEVKHGIEEILRLAQEQLADTKGTLPEPAESANPDPETGDSRGGEGEHAGGQASHRNSDVSESSGVDSGVLAMNKTATEAAPQDGRTANDSEANGRDVNGISVTAGPSLAILWLWPLFMCGTECTMDERRWVLDRMYAMGSINADRTAQLLTEVTKQQDETNQRVDQRSIRQRIFADEFDLVY